MSSQTVTARLVISPTHSVSQSKQRNREMEPSQEPHILLQPQSALTDSAVIVHTRTILVFSQPQLVRKAARGGGAAEEQLRLSRGAGEEQRSQCGAKTVTLLCSLKCRSSMLKKLQSQSFSVTKRPKEST